MPTLRRAFAALCLLLLTCALFSKYIHAEPLGAEGGAKHDSFAHNPYDAQLAGILGQLSRPTAPTETAVLLARVYRLREFVDDRRAIAQCLEHVAADAQQHPLVRDEARHYLALIDIHEDRLEAATAKFAALGFVREWAIAGPFAASQALDTQIGPEQGFHAGQSLVDAAGKHLGWRTLPDVGPRPVIDLATFLPHAGAAVAFAATSIYSARAQTVALRFTAESSMAVIVNGRQAFFDRSGEAAIGIDQHAVAVNLHAGWNAIVLKLAHGDNGPWRFALRITAPEGGGVVLRASANQPAATAITDIVAAAAPADLVDMAKARADGDPASATALEILGLLEHEHARAADLEHLQTAARRSPTPARWLSVADNCSDAACTFAALTAALRLQPGNERALLALANYYAGRNQFEKARTLLRQAVQLEPSDFTARNALADLYIAVGLNTQALRESEQLERDFPAPLWLKRKLAARYVSLGMLDGAHALLTAALREDFDDEQQRSLLLHLYGRRRDRTGLRQTYGDMARLNPANSVALAELAALDAGAGDYPSALRLLRAALAVSPEDSSLRQRLAGVMARAGRPADAQRELARALDSNPTLESARRRLQMVSATDRQSDPDAEYIVNAAVVAKAARQAPPAASGTAVSLADVRVARVLENGLSSVRVQQLFYMASAQGAREYATRSVQYAPGSQELQVLNARVYKADGSMVEGDDAGENAVAAEGVAMYYDVRSRLVRFPTLEKGDVVALDYRISPSRNVNPYGDYFGDLVVFRSPVPQKLQRYVLVTPARRRFNVLEQRMTPAVVAVRGSERVYRWEMRDAEPLPNEPRGPALTDVAPYVHVSTFQSWGDLGRWYAQLIAPQFALDANLREALSHLLKDKRTELDKISAIHQFVLRNTHYVAMEFGIYSYKPYPVAQTYARRFGDCKDKASLMIALLRQAGIDADIALVRTRRLGEIDPQATSIALFNHAIAYVPKYDLWLDGTAEYAGLHELPLDDQGAAALVVALDGSASLRHIPVTQPSDNYTRRTVRAQLMPDGRIQFEGVAYTRGQHAPGLRRDYESPERQRDAVRNSLAEVFPSVHVDDVRVEGANDLERAVTVEFRGELDTFAGQATMPLASSWMPRSYVQTLASLASRREDLLLPAPWTTEEELHFQLPAGAAIKAMPADTVLETPFGSLAVRYQRNAREIVVRTSVQFRRLRITPADYAGFRDFCRDVERAFHSEIKLGLHG